MGFGELVFDTQAEKQARIDAVSLAQFMETIRRFEDGRSDKTVLENIWFYYQSKMNLLTKFSPWAVYNHWVKKGPNIKGIPFFDSLVKAQQNVRTLGNDVPYSVEQAQKLFGNGFEYYSLWGKADSFGEVWKSVAPVIIGAVLGIAGGPVGVIGGAVAGAAKSKSMDLAERQERLNQIGAAIGKDVTAISVAESQKTSFAGIFGGGSGSMPVIGILVFVFLFLMIKPKKR